MGKRRRSGGRKSLDREASVNSALSELVDLDDMELTFDNVVKVFVTIQEPDYSSPWQTMAVESCTGSGVIIETSDKKLRILTAAHVVCDSTFLQCQRVGVENPDKRPARVYAVCHDCDLALLEVDVGADDEFWSDVDPAPLVGIPALRSVVLIAGFPVGGDELSVTSGIVSRIEGQPYSQSRRTLLAVTVDAAINAGNSGGPAFNDGGGLVGIAFQSMTNAENTGHVVPPPVIEHFLRGVAASGPEGYGGFPDDGFRAQELSNPHLRRHYGLDESVRGVLITDVLYGNTCHGVLEKNDILTHIAGRQVANNGTLAYGTFGTRLDHGIAFTLLQCGESIELDVVRAGTKQKLTATAKPFVRLVPLPEYDKKPRYFIYCGLVFQPLSHNYADTFDCFPRQLTAMYDRQSADKLECVVLTSTLSDRVNVGYETITQAPIDSVDGTKVRDLRHLVELIEAATEPLLRITTKGEQHVIILPSRKDPKTVLANERILSRYKIARDRCLD